MDEEPSRGTAVATAGTRYAWLLVLVLLLVVTIGARLPGLVQHALWQDEVATLRVISMPTLRSALGQVVRGDSTPPAFYVVARAADRAASPIAPTSRAKALRLLSIAFAVGCTWLTFVLASGLVALWAAALAGLLVSIGAILVLQGSMLRAYSMLAFACVLFAYLLERAAARPGVARLALLAAVVAVGSLTHYFFLVTLGAGLLWLLSARSGRSAVTRVASAIGLGLIPLALWSPYWLEQYRNGIYSTAPRFTFARLLELFPSMFVPHPVVGDMGLPLTGLVTLVVLVSAVLLLRRPEGRLCALLVLAPVLTVSVTVWASGERIFHTRNLIGVAPFAAIALAWGCASLPWRRLSYAAGALVAGIAVAGFVYGEVNLGRTPYDRIAGELVTQGFRADEPILWFGAYGGIKPVAWYLTASEGSQWPMVRLSSPTGDPCRAVAVVARNRTGRRWLDQHREAVLAEAAVPAFGDLPHGRRTSDVVVARVAWRDGILDRPEGARSRFRFHLAGGEPPCLWP